MAITVKTDKIILDFDAVCPKCGYEVTPNCKKVVSVDVYQIVDTGIPCCPECDADLDIRDTCVVCISPKITIEQEILIV